MGVGRRKTKSTVDVGREGRGRSSLSLLDDIPERSLNLHGNLWQYVLTPLTAFGPLSSHWQREVRTCALAIFYSQRSYSIIPVNLSWQYDVVRVWHLQRTYYQGICRRRGANSQRLAPSPTWNSLKVPRQMYLYERTRGRRRS